MSDLHRGLLGLCLSALALGGLFWLFPDTFGKVVFGLLGLWKFWLGFLLLATFLFGFVLGAIYLIFWWSDRALQKKSDTSNE